MRTPNSRRYRVLCSIWKNTTTLTAHEHPSEYIAIADCVARVYHVVQAWSMNHDKIYA